MAKSKVLTRKVTLTGIADIMFDRYAGDNKTELQPHQKMYFAQDGKSLVIPSTNLLSFLSAQNTPSAAKRFMDPRAYKKMAQALLSYVMVSPFEIPLTREGKPVVFHGFNDDDVDDKGGIYIHRSVARLANGIPNPKVRPTVRLPWEVKFDLSIYPNDEFNEELLLNLFERGGIAIGLGTFRGVYGKFRVSEWK